MWKDIEGWENFYEVSSEGLVRNKSTNKLITIDYSNKSGYARVTLYHKGRRERFLCTVGHTGIHAWGNRVRRQFFGGGAVVVEPRIPRLQPWGVSNIQVERQNRNRRNKNDYRYHKQ